MSWSLAVNACPSAAIGCPGEFLPGSMEMLKHELRVPQLDFHHMGVSENSVPLNPMVNDHYPY